MRLAAIVLFLSTPSLCSADVSIVRPAGNLVFDEIHEAVDAAMQGDTLLVGPGEYAKFAIDDKELSILAVPAGADVRIDGPVEILPGPARTIVLSGLTIQGVGNKTGMIVTGPVANLRLQDSTLLGGEVPNQDSGTALIVSDCPALVVVRSQIIGGTGPDDFFLGYEAGPGIVASNSEIALYDCIVQGGDGGGSDFQGADGANGFDGTGTFVFGSSTAFVGGDGGSAEPGQVYGDGGHGYVSPGLPEAQILDCAFQGGTSGPGGQAGKGICGPVEFLPGAGRAFELAAAAWPDRTELALTVRGEPGDQVFVRWNSFPSFLYSPALLGVEVTPAGPLGPAAALGEIPPGGTLQSAFTMPAVRGNLRYLSFLQGYVVSAQREFVFGSPMHVSLIDRGVGPDCNQNGFQDLAEVLFDPADDCNENLVPDSCDIANGTSQDQNGNGIPDECEGP